MCSLLPSSSKPNMFTFISYHRDCLVTFPTLPTLSHTPKVHFYTHGGIGRPVNPSTGLIMGHEASGTISSIGSSVRTLKIGDRVAIEPGTPCRRCTACKSGTYNLCRRMLFAAAPGPPNTPGTPGTLSKFYEIAEDFCYVIPDAVGLQEAVLVEPLAVAIHAVKLGDVRPG